MRHKALLLPLVALLASCATTPTTAYRVRPVSAPDQSPQIVNLERYISQQQAQLLESQGALMDISVAREKGFDVERVVERIAASSERPNLYYRVFVLGNSDPNAAALPDGRAYVSLGMLDYLKDRGGREDELAFILAHEIAHTCAQHTLKNVLLLQEQQRRVAWLEVLGATIMAAASDPYSPYYGYGVQSGAALGEGVANLINQAQTEGFSQDQELEADQLALRYMVRAGYEPAAAVSLLADMARFEFSGPFLQTHPPFNQRAEDAQRFLADMGDRVSVYASDVPTNRPPVSETVPPTSGEITVAPIAAASPPSPKLPMQSTVVVAPGLVMYSNIEILTELQHQEFVSQALQLLKFRAPDTFALVKEHIARIEQSDRDWVDITYSPSVCEISTETLTSSSTLLASFLAESAYRIKRFPETKTFFAQMPPLSLTKLQAQAAKYRFQTLQQLRAPKDEIARFRRRAVAFE